MPVGAEGLFVGYAGTAVTLTGTGLQPTTGALADQVFFGATQAQVLSVSATAISVLTPNAPADQTEVYIKSPEHGVETQRLPFTVLGKPQLTGVTPASAQPGYILTLRGSQFDDQATTKVEVRGAAGGKYALLRDVSADTIMAQMPTVDQPGDSLSVQVWTPAGVSEARALVREAGLATPDPPACPAEAEFPLGLPHPGE